MEPSESERVTTLPPSWVTFWTAYCATFPEPEMATVLPFRSVFLVFSISSQK